jgi:hypothetical protein
VDKLKADLAAKEKEATAAREEAQAGSSCKITLSKVRAYGSPAGACLRSNSHALEGEEVAMRAREFVVVEPTC